MKAYLRHLLSLIVLAMLVLLATNVSADDESRARRYQRMSEHQSPGDGSAPVIIGASALPQYTRNGDTMTILVDANCAEAVYWTVDVVYTSTWFDESHDPGQLYLDKADGSYKTYYVWKTEAAGLHSEQTLAPTTSISDFEIEVGPRVYHSDKWTVTVKCHDESGEWSSPYKLSAVTIDMPFDTPDTWSANENGFVVSHIGSQFPTQYNLGSLTDFSKGFGVWFSASFIDGGPWDPVGEDHFVDRIRAEVGSKNKWVVGFLDNNVVFDETYPIECVWWSLLDEQVGLGNEDYVVRDVNGDFPHPRTKQYMLNYGNPDAVDFAVAYYLKRLNHVDNREPNTGWCFDVTELSHYMPLIDPDTGLSNWYSYVADCDQDGVVMADDYDEQEAYFLGQISFLSKLRTAIENSDSESDVGDYWILGGNSISARVWPAMAAEMDFTFLEGMSLPSYIGTEFIRYNGVWWDESDNEEEIWKWAFSSSWHLTRPTDMYLSTAYLEFIGYPSQTMSAAFEDAAAYMDQTGNPPIRMLESQSGHSRMINHDCDNGTTPKISDPVHVHPEALEVICLLYDNSYPVWIKFAETSWPRQPWGPVREGFVSLDGLGTPQEAAQNDGGGFYSRTYSNGEVKVFIDEVNWDYLGEYTICGAGTDDPGQETYITTWPSQPEWQVTITGTGVVRESDNWADPVTIASLAMVDDLITNSIQEVDLSVTGGGSYYWRWCGIGSSDVDPYSVMCTSVDHGSWSSWTLRSAPLVDWNPGLTETANKWNGIYVEVSPFSAGPSSSSDCSSFKNPK